MLQSFSVFLKFFIIDKLPSLFFTERGATCFINDMILRQSYQDNDNLVNSFIHILKTPTANKGDISASSCKSYENIGLPKSSYLFRENDKKRSRSNKSVGDEIFNYDCVRLGVNDQTQREWYYALLKKLSFHLHLALGHTYRTTSAKPTDRFLLCMVINIQARCKLSTTLH